MKKIFLLMIISLLIFTGCTDTTSSDENGNKTREFTVGQTATVNKTEIKINSVKKILKECSWEYNGKCESYTEPKKSFFLLIDLTINNKGTEDINVSSLMSFDLKNADGEKSEYALLTNAITSQLDGSVMPNDLLKGQVAFDVTEANEYYFYYSDSLLDDPIKFTIKPTDITE